jgi:hypothetical protein
MRDHAEILLVEQGHLQRPLRRREGQDCQRA